MRLLSDYKTGITLTHVVCGCVALVCAGRKDIKLITFTVGQRSLRFYLIADQFWLNPHLYGKAFVVLFAVF